jgi:hypothetical protein
MHYVKIINENGTEPGTNETLTKQLPNPTELFSTIILNRECGIYWFAFLMQIGKRHFIAAITYFISL